MNDEPAAAANTYVHIRRPTSFLLLVPSRDLKGLFFQVALPVCVVALTLLILTIQYSPAGPSLPLSPSIYDDLNKNGAKAEVYVSGKNVVGKETCFD